MTTKTKQSNYRTTKFEVSEVTGPHSRWELFKAFFRDDWKRSKFQWTKSALFWWLISVAIVAELVIALDAASSISHDTGSTTRECMESCETLGGIWLDRNRYGCFCYANGEQRVLQSE